MRVWRRARRDGGRLLVAALLVVGGARAEEPAVPASLLTRLLARAATYDRNFQKRAPSQAKIFIVTSGSADSQQFTGQLKRALADESLVGGVPHVEEEVAFTSAGALATRVRKDHPSIVFLTPGLDEASLKAVAAAFNGLDVLSACASSACVNDGIALGFDLVSGKPRLVVNVKQAQKQGVAFGADLLRLAQVVDP